MSGLYKLLICDDAGTLLTEVTDFLWIEMTREVNQPGYLDFCLKADHSAVAQLEYRGVVELWRKDSSLGFDWYCEWRALFLGYETPYDEYELYIAHCMGPLWLLGTRIIAFPSQVTDRSTFSATPAETIAKTLVQYNATSDATTANGRIRDGEITGISIEADAAGGDSLSWPCGQDNLLASLQRLAEAGGVDFELVYGGGGAWEFQVYAAAAADKTATVKFSLALGNIGPLLFVNDRRSERTAAIVGGRGWYDQREFVVELGPAHASSNNTEMFINASHEYTTAHLQALGILALQRNLAIKKLSFRTVQTPACRYGQEYYLDELVTALYNGTSYTVKVMRVHLRLDGLHEDLGVYLETT
jgi:hypothetical protein